MALELYDTARGAARVFEPLVPGRVTMYVCGATVHGPPHLGHLRSAVSYDVLRRWLAHRGLDVHLVRNTTDIDDTILARAHDAGRPWWEWAARFEREFAEAYDAVGCLPPSIQPRATGHVTEAVDLIGRLLARGHAYVVEGADGDEVYFDVSSWSHYGQLSGQRLDEVRSDPGGSPTKRDHRDFVLWKSARRGEPSWSSPWGAGRPSWHVECSAMSTRYLGARFDIHGGGRDLLFPHHENEQAQSRAAGDGFAARWMHHGWVTVADEKMSKSVGNVVTLRQTLEKVRPVELRAHLLGAHYRSSVAYSERALLDAATAYRRIEAFVLRSAERAAAETLPDSFSAALDADLSTPAAMRVVHEFVTDGNRALDDGREQDAADAARAVTAMLRVLGLDPHRASEGAGRRPGRGSAERGFSALVEELVSERDAARRSGGFDRADRLREQLARAGVEVEDTPHGPRWTVRTTGDRAGRRP